MTIPYVRIYTTRSARVRTRPIARSFVFTYNRNVFVIYQSERNSTHTYLVAPRTMYVRARDASRGGRGCAHDVRIYYYYRWCNGRLCIEPRVSTNHDSRDGITPRAPSRAFSRAFSFSTRPFVVVVAFEENGARERATRARERDGVDGAIEKSEKKIELDFTCFRARLVVRVRERSSS